MLLLLSFACAPHVSWEIQPVPSLALPSMEVAVIAEGRDCKDVADEMVASLAARPDVVVRADAPIRLTVSECQEHVLVTVAMMSYSGVAGYVNPGDAGGGLFDTIAPDPARVYEVEGTATATLRIQGSGVPTPAVPVKVVRKDHRDDALPVGQTLLTTMRKGLNRDLGWALADQIAPLPETLRRTLYKDPEPGTARDLHNDAVKAEQDGDLDEALRLARAAYAADPTPAAMQYIQLLQAHAERVGYALRQ